MRKHELLSDSERKQLLNIPDNRDDLVRLYTFEQVEIDLILQRREDHNRLGVALQLALLRHPGMTMTQMLDNGGLPDNLVIFIAEQIGIPMQALSDYALRGQTMTDHAREMALALGMRPAARSDIPMMIEAAASSAWATDKGVPIVNGIVAALRQAKIVLPAPATIERAGIAGRARARKLATQTLVSGLKPAQMEMLDKLSIADPATGISPLAWLKAIPVAPKPDNVREIIDRLMFVRKIGIPAPSGAALHPDRYRQFVREGRMSPAYMIERCAPSRRRATVVAFLINIEERLTDAVIEMADKMIGSMFTRAKNMQARAMSRRQKTFPV